MLGVKIDPTFKFDKYVLLNVTILFNETGKKLFILMVFSNLMSLKQGRILMSFFIESEFWCVQVEQ